MQMLLKFWRYSITNKIENNTEPLNLCICTFRLNWNFVMNHFSIIASPQNKELKFIGQFCKDGGDGFYRIWLTWNYWIQMTLLHWAAFIATLWRSSERRVTLLKRIGIAITKSQWDPSCMYHLPHFRDK